MQTGEGVGGVPGVRRHNTGARVELASGGIWDVSGQEINEVDLFHR